MQVKNCRECGRLFNYIAGMPICPTCKEALEKKFTEVKDYIRENKNATVQSVSEECEVSEQIIRQWIREERLVFTNPSVAGITCEICGTPITTGRFCDKCKLQTMNDLKGLVPKAEPSITKSTKDSPKMRFLDRK